MLVQGMRNGRERFENISYPVVEDAPSGLSELVMLLGDPADTNPSLPHVHRALSDHRICYLIIPANWNCKRMGEANDYPMCIGRLLEMGRRIPLPENERVGGLLNTCCGLSNCCPLEAARAAASDPIHPF